MNNEELAQSIVRGTYTEQSAETLIGDWDRLSVARDVYEDKLAEIEWAYYKHAPDDRPSTLEVFIELGMHAQIVARLRDAIRVTRDAMEILQGQKYNTHTWSLVCEDCRYVLETPYTTWMSANKARNTMLLDGWGEETKPDTDCVLTLKIMPTNVARLAYETAERASEQGF